MIYALFIDMEFLSAMGSVAEGAEVEFHWLDIVRLLK